MDEAGASPTRVEIEEVPADAREIVVEGRVLFRGQRLSALIKEFDGYQGEVEQPSTGKRFAVSLEPWRDRDADTTWIEFSFVTDK
jgi:hypothetical protein